MRSFLPARLALLPMTVLPLSACSDLTAPAPYKPEPQAVAAAEPAPAAPSKPATVKPAAARADDGAEQPNAAAESEMLEASHVLIAFKGAMRSEATRSKEEALKLAEQVVSQAKAGKSFADLAKQHSDDKGSAAKGGSLGRFPVKRMVKQFSDAVSALKPGEISGAIESPFGFHVILRSP